MIKVIFLFRCRLQKAANLARVVVSPHSGGADESPYFHSLPIQSSDLPCLHQVPLEVALVDVSLGSAPRTRIIFKVAQIIPPSGAQLFHPFHRADDVRYFNPEPFIDHHHFPPGDEFLVNEDLYWFSRESVEFNHRSLPELQ